MMMMMMQSLGAAAAAALLLSTCVLWTEVGSMETITTCDDGSNVHRLTCEMGVIKVYSALYGRTDGVTCSEGKPAGQLANTACSQDGTVDVVRNRCNGKKVCEMNTAVFQTSDPCFGIFKYVQTKYSCFPAKHIVVCDGSSAHLNCDQGQVIQVYAAYYGRTEKETCSYKRPNGQVQTIDCILSTSKVSASCDGKRSCTLAVTSSLFTDPCSGTYKYLEAAYTCECSEQF